MQINNTMASEFNIGEEKHELGSYHIHLTQLDMEERLG